MLSVELTTPSVRNNSFRLGVVGQSIYIIEN